MNLKHLEYFACLAECEHYTLAAQRLNISQSSLSKAIRAMEQELGVYLFEHVGRNVRLTKAGSRYLRSIRPAIRELNAATDRLRREQARTEGFLDIGLTTSIVSHEFVEWTRGFLAEETSGLYFSCHTALSSQLIDGLKRDHYDMIFCTPYTDEPLLRFVPVCRQQVVLVVPDGHPLQRRTSISFSELDGMPLITHTADTGIWKVMEQELHARGGAVRSVGEASEDRTLLSLVRAGIAPALMTDPGAYHMEGVSRIPITGAPRERYICMAWRRDREPSEPVRRFRSYILAHADPAITSMPPITLSDHTP